MSRVYWKDEPLQFGRVFTSLLFMSAEGEERLCPCLAIDSVKANELADAFKRADKNGDGSLDRKEFMAVMESVIDRKQAKYIFDTVDQSGDLIWKSFCLASIGRQCSR